MIELIQPDNFILQHIQQKIIEPPPTDFSSRDRCQNIWKKVLYGAGAALAFGGQLSYIKQAQQASSNPILTGILVPSTYISSGIFFAWLNKNILDDLMTSHPEEIRPFMEKELSVWQKTSIVAISVLLGALAISSDVDFAIHFNKPNIVFPILTAAGVINGPVYSIMKSIQGISTYLKYTPLEKKLYAKREELYKAVGRVKREILANPDATLDRLCNPNLIESQVPPSQALLETIISKNRELSSKRCTNFIPNCLASTGFPLGVAQLAITFLGAKEFITRFTKKSYLSYPFSALSTATVSYLYFLDIPKALKKLVILGKNTLKNRKITTIGAKLAPKINAAILTAGLAITAFSWGDLKTLGASYFTNPTLKQIMEIALPLGDAILSAYALVELSDDIIKDNNTPQNANIKTLLKLEELEYFLKKVSLGEIAKLIQEVGPENPEIYTLVSSVERDAERYLNDLEAPLLEDMDSEIMLNPINS